MCSVNVRLIRKTVLKVITNYILVKRLYKRVITKGKILTRRALSSKEGGCPGSEEDPGCKVSPPGFVACAAPAGSATLSHWLCLSVPLTRHL